MIKIVNVGGLNFRKGPGTSYSVIRVLTKGEEVEVISESNGWSKIRNKGSEGYVASRYLSNKEEKEEVIEIKEVNVGGLNFRKGPGTSYSVIRVLTKGE
ncbi:SH3 domain-containing protein, partial [Paraclostridium bifermentans]|uniref:SH3 domain-containing protein n=1 Tax=Paraclostridium bifermentans TaxID=1490 RepID=UPI00359C71ED